MAGTVVPCIYDVMLEHKMAKGKFLVIVLPGHQWTRVFYNFVGPCLVAYGLLREVE